MASFLYPRTIKIVRPTQATGVGVIGYGGAKASTDEPVASNLPASIQFKKPSGNNEADLPGNAGRSLWRILIPLASAQNGLIKSRDVVIDDLGCRYQVVAPYWNSLGYNIMTEKLEA